MSEQKSESISKQKLSKLVLNSVLDVGIKILVQKFYLEIAKIALSFFTGNVGSGERDMVPIGVDFDRVYTSTHYK